ncbi:MAG: glycosyltransferase [Acidobacteriota bacterium]|nr:glycosyltransferase [Acidobacteriota bacterium]
MNASIAHTPRHGASVKLQSQSGAIDGAVVLSPFFWNFRDDMWQTTHHVARVLAARVPTILVEPPVQWNPHNAEFRWHRIANGIFGRRMRHASERLGIFGRRGFPFGRLAPLRRIQEERNARALRRVLDGTGWRRVLLWHSFPYDSEALVDTIDCEQFVYHCLDDSPREEERRLVDRADVVFGVSRTIVDKYRARNPRTFLLPNGVDIELFDPDRAGLAPRPRDLPASGRILGFLGYVNYHVDLELLLKIARAFPRDHVVLVGRVPSGHTAPEGRQQAALEILGSLPNVRILGFKPTAQLPAYLHACDVCLIPFLRNRFNRQCDPLKFYQYMAMGKPVVSTPVTVARQYPEACGVAESDEEFIAAIADTLERGDSAREREARRAVARAHSWPALINGAWRMLEEIRTDRKQESSK